MSPALCSNKLSFTIIVIIMSSCCQFTQQQRQAGFPFGVFNEVEVFEKKSSSPGSSLKHENWFHPGQELVFITTTPKPITLRPGQPLIFITTTAKPAENSVVYINNKPTVATKVPFIPEARTASSHFLDCFGKCPSTSEFNPVCATNRQVYANEGKFNCARYCGAALLWMLLYISSITAVARVDSKWSYKRSKVVAAQNYRSQTAFRTASVNNQTQWNNFNQQHNNRTQFNQPGYRPAAINPQHPKYGQVALNQTRPSWQQPSAPNHAPYPAYGQQGNFNQTRPTWQQPQAPNHASYPAFNQTKPSIPNYPYPASGNFNQTRALWPQPVTPKVASNPTFPTNGQRGSFNQTTPVWHLPSAPQLPNYPGQPINSNSWPSSTNQTGLYPKVPNSNSPQTPSANGLGSQGPHNWHSGGQAVLSYGPGFKPLPAGNKTLPANYGSSNPYANIFH